MRRAAARASASSGLSQRETLAAIAARDEHQMVGRWRDQISESDRTDVARILATFGVTLYSSTRRAELAATLTTASGSSGMD